MAALLLSVHVVAAIVLIGPVTAAASLFPRYARQAGAELPARSGADGVVRALHRITAGYALVAVAVPVFGIATALELDVLRQSWVLVSMALTAVAAGLLAAVVVPGQRRVLQLLDAPAPVQVEALAHVEAPAGAGRPPAAGPRTHPQADGELPRLVARLSMTTGVFALTWAAVVVLMILRPGSTTGV